MGRAPGRFEISLPGAALSTRNSDRELKKGYPHGSHANHIHLHFAGFVHCCAVEYVLPVGFLVDTRGWSERLASRAPGGPRQTLLRAAWALASRGQMNETAEDRREIERTGWPSRRINRSASATVRCRSGSAGSFSWSGHGVVRGAAGTGKERDRGRGHVESAGSMQRQCSWRHRSADAGRTVCCRRGFRSRVPTTRSSVENSGR